MEENGWTGRTVTLKYKLETFQGNGLIHVVALLKHYIPVFTRSKSFDRWIKSKEDLYQVCQE